MREIAKILLQAKAVLLQPTDPFTFVSGIKSPIYTDCRVLISLPKERMQIVAALVKNVQPLKPDAIAGTATAAIPWAAWLAHELDLPMAYVRKEEKTHGAGKRIEGALPPKSKVLLVEDLISTGQSSLSAIDALQKDGHDVVACVAIFTYGMPRAMKDFKASGARLVALTNFSELVAEASASGILKDDDRERVMSWAKDPEGGRHDHA